MSSVVLLDQSEVFDIVDHGTLTAKMSALEPRDSMLVGELFIRNKILLPS